VEVETRGVKEGRTCGSVSVLGLRRGSYVRRRVMNTRDTEHTSWSICRWVLREASPYGFLIGVACATAVLGTLERPQMGEV